MNDEQLAELTKEVDDKLLKWLTSYSTSPLSLCAVLMERLTWMEKLTGKGKPQIEGVEPLYKGEIGSLSDGFWFVKDLKGSSNA